MNLFQITKMVDKFKNPSMNLPTRSILLLFASAFALFSFSLALAQDSSAQGTSAQLTPTPDYSAPDGSSLNDSGPDKRHSRHRTPTPKPTPTPHQPSTPEATPKPSPTATPSPTK